MVQLSKRLQMVAGMVTKGNRAADIGCDHAHTSIYLIEQKIAARVIALDVNKGPLLSAARNVERYGLTESIDIRLSDGARELNPYEADTLLISGMGGALTIRILKESEAVVSAAKELVLQPQSEIASVRRFLHASGFRIMEEDMLLEDGKYYTAIHTVKGNEQYDREIDYRYGKLLLENQNAALHDFLINGRKKSEEIIKELLQKAYDKKKERLHELEQELLYQKEALEQYGE